MTIHIRSSVKQSRCRRSPAWWQPGCSRFLIQVGEYLVDHRRVFDAGDDADITTAFAAGFDIDIEYTFQSLYPGH